MPLRREREGTLWRLVRRFAPGLEALLRYQRSWLTSDLGAGLSVAAIALPVGIAYSELAGVPAVVGMYSAIFPLLAYAIFGSSRQLMVGPDAATCLMVAASLGHLSGGDPEKYLALLVVLTLMTYKTPVIKVRTTMSARYLSGSPPDSSPRTTATMMQGAASGPTIN